MAAYQKFNQFIADVMNKQHDFSSDTFKLALTNTAPSVANTGIGDITQVANGNGYVTGGKEIVISDASQTAGTFSAVPNADVVFTATGTVPPFRYVVLYNETSGRLVSFYDRGAEVNMLDTETFTVDVGATLFTAE